MQREPEFEREPQANCTLARDQTEQSPQEVPVERVPASTAPSTPATRRRKRLVVQWIIWGLAAIVLTLFAVAFATRGRL